MRRKRRGNSGPGADDEDGNIRVVAHLVDRAAKKEVTDQFVAVRRHRDQIARIVHSTGLRWISVRLLRDVPSKKRPPSYSTTNSVAPGPSCWRPTTRIGLPRAIGSEPDFKYFSANRLAIASPQTPESTSK